MKKYTNPEMKITVLEVDDLITTSISTTNPDTFDDSNVPDDGWG